MAIRPDLIYWDTSVFLAYFQAEPGRVDDVQSWLSQTRHSRGRQKIVTSTLTIAEVAFYADEHKTKQLQPNAETQIDALLFDRALIDLIEPHEGIMRQARLLIRSTLLHKLTKLRSADAIHLASAQLLQVSRVHSYDTDWPKFTALIERPIGPPEHIPRATTMFEE